MATFRIWLVAFILILAVTPFSSVYFVKENNRRFEEEERRYIQKFGTSDGLYGDCSGASIIIPFAFFLYATVFAIWSLVLTCIAGALSKQAVLIQTILIGVIGVFPALLWELLVFTR